MPFATDLPTSLTSIGLDLGVVTIPNTTLGNFFDSSQEFDTYDVGAGNDTTLSSGDSVALLDGTDNITGDSSYVGTASISTAEVGLDIGIAGITLQVNPVTGSLIESETGDVYFVSDSSVTDADLLVTATISVLGQDLTVTAPISELASSISDTITDANLGFAGTIVAATVASSQTLLENTLNAAAVTMDVDTTEDTILPVDSVICFVAGTLIETNSGLVAVEQLRVGDLVATRDHGLQPVCWVGSIHVSGSSLSRNPKLQPIRIRAGALGRNTPAADLLVSPQHRVLVRSRIARKMFDSDEVLVAAKHLLGLEGVEIASDVQTVTYCHFLCAAHEIVFANGAESETMFTGPVALRSVSKAAQDEILALFPMLADPDYIAVPARPLVRGRKSRALVSRHMKNEHLLVH
ncbi:Hint domain-containing protein [Falsirhodobacter sp. alg1]|uniref:Hint domain-containing protein n=1 Tax=Falsirhodobacter sp. alg1 TaxID=1472418 RepID=UPI0005EE20BC|nr:Hint domain-containing protein [Falsirhodobacter sp. alg1]